MNSTICAVIFPLVTFQAKPPLQYRSSPLYCPSHRPLIHPHLARLVSCLHRTASARRQVGLERASSGHAHSATARSPASECHSLCCTQLLTQQHSHVADDFLTLLDASLCIDTFDLAYEALFDNNRKGEVMSDIMDWGVGVMNRCEKLQSPSYVNLSLSM